MEYPREGCVNCWTSSVMKVDGFVTFFNNCIVFLCSHNNRSYCSSNHSPWKFICHNRALDCTFFVDLLLCCKVCCYSSTNFLIVISNIFCASLVPPLNGLIFGFRSKKLGLVLKILVLVSLPVPLILWPVFGIIGSLLGGVGYGVFTPLAATLTATGMNIIDKLYHCLIVCYPPAFYLLI